MMIIYDNLFQVLSSSLTSQIIFRAMESSGNIPRITCIPLSWGNMQVSSIILQTVAVIFNFRVVIHMMILIAQKNTEFKPRKTKILRCPSIDV